MAIKAGLVGVNPKGVDKNGMPIGSGGGSVDAYTKAETDTLLNGKVSNSQLTANNKAFHFAYDNTSEKYGYKLDGTGDFIPFEQAGGGPGWVKPADLTTEGLQQSRLTVVDGGYFVDTETGIVYIDLTVERLYTGSVSLKGFPRPQSGSNAVLNKGTVLDTVMNDYNIYTTASITTQDNLGIVDIGSSGAVGNYCHMFGTYKLYV